MTRWLLSAVAVFAVAFAASADEPKKPNPFTSGKPLPDQKQKADKKPADDKPEGKVARVAHIKLSGDLDESPVPAESLFGTPPENLRIKLDRIKKAAKDDRISALYVELKDLEVGFGKVHEIRRAIADFRAAGKKAYAYAESLGTKEYLVALACDGIAMPESGELGLYGLRAEVTYYKNTLDLLKLKADVLKMGAYKSAVEPFLTDKMSPENREQVTALLDDNYENEIVAAIIKGRPAKKWTAADVKGIIDQGPFTAKKALELGLLDGLLYEDQFEGRLKKELKADEVRFQKDYAKAKAADVDFSNPFAMLERCGRRRRPGSKEPKIAVIYAVGGIASGKGGADPFMGGETVGSDTMVAAIRQADKDATVKAIVLRVDSPGGSALASDVIWRALKVCKKPVVASMGDVAASGGYYIAAAGKKIYAEPGTVTGSIGVFGLKLVTGGLEEWAGMKTEVVSRGKNSGVTSTTFAWSESERKALTDDVEDIYAQFIDKVAGGPQGGWQEHDPRRAGEAGRRAGVDRPAGQGERAGGRTGHPRRRHRRGQEDRRDRPEDGDGAVDPAEGRVVPRQADGGGPRPAVRVAGGADAAGAGAGQGDADGGAAAADAEGPDQGDDAVSWSSGSSPAVSPQGASSVAGAEPRDA